MLWGTFIVLSFIFRFITLSENGAGQLGLHLFCSPLDSGLPSLFPVTPRIWFPLSLSRFSLSFSTSFPFIFWSVLLKYSHFPAVTLSLSGWWPCSVYYFFLTVLSLFLSWQHFAVASFPFLLNLQHRSYFFWEDVPNHPKASHSYQIKYIIHASLSTSLSKMIFKTIYFCYFYYSGYLNIIDAQKDD